MIKKNLITDLSDMLDELIVNHGGSLKASFADGSVKLTFSRQEDDIRFSLAFSARKQDAEDDES